MNECNKVTGSDINNNSNNDLSVSTRPTSFQKKFRKDAKGNLILKKKMQIKKTFNFDRSNFIQMKSKSLFDEYTIKEKLGEGAYGCVYKVQHKFTNFLRAVKAIKRKHVDSTDFSNKR